MKPIAITIQQWNPLPVLKYPYKWDSNIVSTTMKSIAITITQWNPLPVLKYPYKWDSNIVSTSMKSIAITITQWNPLPVLKYPNKWDSNIVSTSTKSMAITITQWISITSTQVPIQVGFKHCIYQHETYSNNHYTMEFITSISSSDTSGNQTLYLQTCL